MSKFLGIDYGTKRIGVAVSDEKGIFAFPKEIISNNDGAIKKIGELIIKEGIVEIVIGESLDFSGNPNPLFLKIDIFMEKLKSSFNLPVRKQNEFLTSAELRKKSKSETEISGSHSRVKKTRKEHVDDRAAALILQRYLDKINLLKNK